MGSTWDTLLEKTLEDVQAGDAQSAVQAGKQAQAERGLTKKQRKEKARQAARVRVFYDVPDWLRDAIQAQAEAERTSASSLAAALLAEGLWALRAGKVDLQKRPSDSPRFDWIVEVRERDAGGGFMRVFKLKGDIVG